MTQGGDKSDLGARQGSRLSGGAKAAGGGQGSGGGPREDDARTAGRGFLLITGAKVWFMVMGAVVNIGLPMLIPAEEFGIYSIVVNAVSLLNMVVITGTIQAVSKLVSERPRDASRIAGRAAMLQWFVGVPLGLIYILGADKIAELFVDPSLGGLVRVSGGVILAYGFYAIFVGVFNGVKAFGRQAALDVTFSTLKTALIIGAVAMGYGVAGMIWGFVVASVVVTGVSLAMVLVYFRGKDKEKDDGEAETKDDARKDVKKLLVYLVLVMLYTFCVNGVLRADLFLLKALVGAAQEGGVELANRVAGVYTAMLNVSRLPYQAVIAVTFVIFPMISRSTFEEDGAATQAYIRGAMRYSLLLLGLLSALLAGNAHGVVLALYGEGYVQGVAPLMILSLATVGFALFFIATTMITGAGKPMVSVVISLVTLALTAGLNYGFINASLQNGLDVEGVVTTASVATAVAMMAGFGLSVAYTVWRFKAGLPLGTLARVALASAIVLGVSVAIPTPSEWGRLAHLGLVAGKGIGGAALFVAVLWFTREFGDEDKNRLSRLIKKRKRAA